MYREKIRQYFNEMSVHKDNRSTAMANILQQSFLRDWLLKKYQDPDTGETDIEAMQAFIKAHIPPKDDWNQIKARLRDGEIVSILAKIEVDLNLRTNAISFALPDYDVNTSETMIEESVWDKSRDILTRSDVQWGQIRLAYRPPSTPEKKDGKIVLKQFANFCPYTLDLDYYKDMRREFTLDEWINVLLEAMDYNANGYQNQVEKLTTLSRLLIFVQNNLNMIELAPKGTGKTYMFARLSKYGTCIASKMSRASLFYNMSSHKQGPIFKNDFIALDEAQTASVNDVDEMRTALKSYLEDGRFKSSDGFEASSKAGLIALANIPVGEMNTNASMYKYLQEMFNESALWDRFHGFIEGWHIPRVRESLKMNGWALNTEYFSSILHMLRNDPSYEAIVDNLIEPPIAADTRDTKAVKRLAAAWLKLLFPHVRSAEDVLYDQDLYYQFNDKCLRPAKEARSIIRRQLALMDEEFANKPLANYQMVKP